MVATGRKPQKWLDPSLGDFDKVVILFSGGIDSTVLMYYWNQREKDIYPLSILYGQRHSRESAASLRICTELGLEDRFQLVDLKGLGQILKSSLTGFGEVPSSSYDKESMSQTVVPNRNMIFLSVAVGYAQSLGAQAVSYAAHGGDHWIYHDCRPEFVAEMRRAVSVSTNDQIGISTPFLWGSKADIVSWGARLGVPFNLTWSCYKGLEYHCGVCGTCVERKNAFKEAGVEDPTRYEE